MSRIHKEEKGTAIIIALLVMILLLGFVAIAVSRTRNETVASSNDASETRTFVASQASLEIVTHNFNKIFDTKLNPTDSDLRKIEAKFPTGFEKDYDFTQTIKKTGEREVVVLTGEKFQGLSSFRDQWQIDTVATNKYDGVQVALRRSFFNNRIPIFQFGIFYDDDLELHPGPRFDFGGRVHSNEHIFFRNNNLWFSSKVTASGEILTDVMRNGLGTVLNARIKNSAGMFVSLRSHMGSALNKVPNGDPVINEPDMPIAYANRDWKTYSDMFDGNLLSNQSKLELPLKITGEDNPDENGYIELIKRGKVIGSLYNDGTGTATSPSIVPVTATSQDSIVTQKERYYNKPGIRVSLADSKAKLPGCVTSSGATVTIPCGIRLDGEIRGRGNDAPSDEANGYSPLKMSDDYQATRINGERFSRQSGVQTWIKIEAVGVNPDTDEITSVDITEDILSLGVTERAPIISEGISIQFALRDYDNTDSRSIIKLQRFVIPRLHVMTGGDTNFISMSGSTSSISTYNIVNVAKDNAGTLEAIDDGPCVSLPSSDINHFCHTRNGIRFGDHFEHWKSAIVYGRTTETNYVVPFPIKMFDTREGLYHDGLNTSSVYGNNLPWAGIFSLVDIDVANLKDFLDGRYDSFMPSGTTFTLASGRPLQGGDIPESQGWVVYVSDRRGDFDFDGAYDMEDIYGDNDGILQFGEDVNDNGILDTDYVNEAPYYTRGDSSTSKDIASTLETRFFRRGVRLINGQSLPGIYDSTTPTNTKGFTFASENGVYVKGNYNSTGIFVARNPTPSDEYLPQNTPNHIPASLVGDSLTLLSNNWFDAKSFLYAFNLRSRQATETTYRAAIMAGAARSSLIEPGEPSQSNGGDKQLTGGVHNFKRTLETWSRTRLNYTGSLINLFSSQNSNGMFKCCSNVYSPPTRNWAFDNTFLDPHRLPPGTPFFQTIDLTGFQRKN